MRCFAICVFALLVLCLAPGSGPPKKFNAEISYKHAGKRKLEVAASSSSAEARGISSESSRTVVAKLFLSNKLSAKDAHAVQLANWCEGNEHVARLGLCTVVCFCVFL